MNTRLTKIRLNCTIFKEKYDLITKLTPIVTYKTRYKDDNIKPVILSFRNRKYMPPLMTTSQTIIQVGLLTIIMPNACISVDEV